MRIKEEADDEEVTETIKNKLYKNCSLKKE